MSADLLRRAADAMVAEAERLESLDHAAIDPPWARDGLCDVEWSLATFHRVGERGPAGDVPNADVLTDRQVDADLIVHRRNTLARDAATLRALAAHMRGASLISRRSYGGLECVARVFLGGSAS